MSVHLENVIGGPDAAVTIVEYGDFECPTCNKRRRCCGICSNESTACPLI